MEEVKGYKLLLSYDVLEEKQREYYQFIMGSYLPALQSVGFQMSEAWHTAYGDAPNRLIGLITTDQDKVKELLESDVWETLNEQLAEYVTDFDYKFIPYRGGFQL